MIARTIGRPIVPVPAICSPGMTPVMLMAMTRKKIVMISGMNRLPSFSPSVSMTMPLRTKVEDELHRRLAARSG